MLPATILSLLEEEYCHSYAIGDYFDLIVGTSTGGLIALGLGAEIPPSKIASIYKEKGEDIFPSTLGIKRWVFRKHNRKNLDQVINDMFNRKLLKESKYHLCIPAIGANYGGEVYIFKTPHHPDYKMDGNQEMATIAKATSSAPTYFSLYKNGENTFIDGGVWVNNPIMVGVVEAMSAFDICSNQIKILSLGCIASKYCLTKCQEKMGGIFSWSKIHEAEMHFQSQNAIGQAGLLIGRENILRIEAPAELKIDMDEWKKATQCLPLIAQEKVKMHGQQIQKIFLQNPSL